MPVMSAFFMGRSECERFGECKTRAYKFSHSARSMQESRAILDKRPAASRQRHRGARRKDQRRSRVCDVLCSTDLVLHWAYGEDETECDSGCGGGFTAGGKKGGTRSTDQRESTGAGVSVGAGGGTEPEAASRSEEQTSE